MAHVLPFLRGLVIWEANGLLAIAYTAFEHLAAILVLAGFVPLLRGLPATSVQQRPWIGATGGAAITAALLAPAPVPFIMAGLTLAAAVAVRLDHYGPDALRWRCTGGLALYALAALAYVAYGAYLTGLDAAAWARSLGGQGEAQQALVQGRAFIDTLARWGLWLIVPLGYLSLLAQGLFAHPPVGARPEELVATIRTRGGR